MKWIFLVLTLLPLGLRADVSGTGAVVDLDQEVSPTASSDGWSSVQAKLSTPQAMKALDVFLQKYPKGPSASHALLEKARRTENLEQAAQWYQASYDEDPQGPWAQAAILDLAKQEYILGLPDKAITLFGQVREDELQNDDEAQLLYWRGQCNMVLKNLERAQDNFESFLRNYPGHPLADSARLAIADCDAGLQHDEAAFEEYRKLYMTPTASTVAPEAMYQAAGLEINAGHTDVAKTLLLALQANYPKSMDASEANDLLKKIPSTPLPVAKTGYHPKVAYTIQVGAYARRIGAMRLYQQLRKKRYAAHLDRRVIADTVFYLVQVGHYATKNLAVKAGSRIYAKEHLVFRVVEASPTL